LCATIGTKPAADPERERRRQQLRERTAHLLRHAAGLGVTIMTGTDIVGDIPAEVAMLTDLGLSPTAALSAATTAARRFLGLPDLADGVPADLVTFDSDPRDDPEVLANPVAVLLNGRRIR
jgi:imidazolonepropionase-like amidohydrolase